MTDGISLGRARCTGRSRAGLALSVVLGRETRRIPTSVIHDDSDGAEWQPREESNVMLTTKETDLLRAERDALASLAAVREQQTAEAQRDRDWCAAGERRVEESNEQNHAELQDACYRLDLSSDGCTDKLIKRLVERSSELERELQQKRNRIDIDGSTIVQLTARSQQTLVDLQDACFRSGLSCDGQEYTLIERLVDRADGLARELQRMSAKDES